MPGPIVLQALQSLDLQELDRASASNHAGNPLLPDEKFINNRASKRVKHIPTLVEYDKFMSRHRV